MTFGSLFAGIGGMDLGLERAGMTCKWQVEIDPYATRVLAKHWPNVRRWGNIKTFVPNTTRERCGAWGPGRTATRLQRRAESAWVTPWRVDLIAGGFPCQDISYAGKGEGLKGKRSGLWYEFARIVRTLRPHYVLVENVSALLNRGLDAVLGTLAADGYDAEWACIPAASVGAPHIRDRIFILGISSCIGCDGNDGRRPEKRCEGNHTSKWNSILADSPGLYAQRFLHRPRQGESWRSGWWESEPDVGRVAHGVPARVDRLRGLGNAVVPQVAEWIGRRILETSNL